MSSLETTVPARSARAGRRRSAGGWAALSAAVLVLGLAGCTGAPETGAPAPADGDSSTAASSSAGAIQLDVTIAGGNVTPNGQKVDVAVGQPVVLKVSSDSHDEIHAHTGGDGFALEVEPGVPATGTFTVTTPGSFEVESHHLEKVIVILNAR